MTSAVSGLTSHSGPTEPTQGEDKRETGPGDQHKQASGLRLSHKWRALEDGGAQGVIERRQGKRADQRLHDGGEALVGEKDAGNNPHGHHHEIDQAADAFDLLSAAGGEQAEAGKGGGAETNPAPFCMEELAVNPELAVAVVRTASRMSSCA